MKKNKKIVKSIILSTLFFLLTITNFVYANKLDLKTINNKNFILSSEQNYKNKENFSLEDKFKFFAKINKNKELELFWQIDKELKLYKKEIKLLNDENKIIDLKESDIKSKSVQYLDDVFGQVKVFEHELLIQKPLKDFIFKKENKVVINYQGCGNGVCYPMQNKVVDLTSLIENGNITQEELNVLIKKDERYDNLNNIWWFFFIGLGLSLTPCVLPMIPLVSNIILNGKDLNKKQHFLLTLSYTQGISISYVVLGIVATLIGMQFSIFLQQPIVLISVSILFILLAMFNFGFMDKINFSNFVLFKPFFSISRKINNLNQNLNGGNFIKTFTMGVIAGLVASPCTTAPLTAILLHISQKGDILNGVLSLYLLSMGISFPLLLISIFGRKILPKSGNWLLLVKEIFGFVILLFPIFLLSRYIELELLISLYLLLIVYWLFVKISKAKIYENNKIKTFSIFLLMFLTAISSYPLINKSKFFVLNEIYNMKEQKSQQTQSSKQSDLDFIEIKNYQDLENIKVMSKKENKPIFFKATAEWCTYCQKLNRILMEEEINKEIKEKFILVKLDLTKSNEFNLELSKKYKIFGLPTIIIFNEKLEEIKYKTGEIEKEKLKDFISI